MRSKVLIFTFVLGLGIFIRLHNYTLYPQRGATSDEYTYSFLGISLLTKHIPISWSSFPSYTHRYDLTINHLYFPMVYPYFDHPPLNGLLVGGFALLFGENTFAKIHLGTIRLLSIILALVSSLLLFSIAKHLYGFKTGVWALLIFNTTTIFVMNTRVVFAENLLSVIFLATISFLIKFKKQITLKRAVLIGILCGGAYLTKILGIAIAFSAAFLMIDQRIKVGMIFLTISVVIIFVLAFIGYGQYFDGPLFWKIQAMQSTRRIGPETLLVLTTTPVIVNKIFYDGWYFFGLFSLFTLFFNYKENKFILVPSFLYFFLLIFSLTKEGLSGWYMIPLFPFMSIAIAHVIEQSVRQKNWISFVFLLFVGLFEFRYLYEEPFGQNSIAFRLYLLLLFIPSLFFFYKNEKLYAGWNQFLFYLFIFGNALISYSYIHPS